jgi:3-dehydroquinate synthase
MYKVKIRTEQKTYPVYLGRSRKALDNVGRTVSTCLPACTALVVSDKNVAAHYGERCLESLRKRGFKPCLEVLEGGEKVKSLASASALYSRALEAGMDRSSVIIALGGGVIGDLAGFVAATYLRGVPYVQLPTTLLAMVDSSVGGKVAVNHPLGKNLIGAFYQPALVVADESTLNTLPGREFNAGLVELVKYGIIWDNTLFERLERSFFASKNTSGKDTSLKKHLLEMNSSRLLKYIVRAVIIKGKIVSQDEKEKDLRRILNFGHTFGHALEAGTSFDYYLHGESVACGMAMAARLAVLLGILDPPFEQRIIALLKPLRVPPPPGRLNLDTVTQALSYDKKKQGEELVFILPTAPGQTMACKAPPASLIKRVIEEYLSGELI